MKCIKEVSAIATATAILLFETVVDLVLDNDFQRETISSTMQYVMHTTHVQILYDSYIYYISHAFIL